MPNGRCRIHGGASPGAPCGERNGNYKNGRFTKETLTRRRAARANVRFMRELIAAGEAGKICADDVIDQLGSLIPK